MTARNFFSTSLVSTCIESNSRFFQSFRPRKSFAIFERKTRSSSSMFRSEESILRTLRDRSSGPGSGLRIDKEQTLHSRPTSLPLLGRLLMWLFFTHCDNGLCQRKRRRKRKLCPCEFWSPQRSFSLQKALERDEKSRKDKQKFHKKTTRNLKKRNLSLLGK